MNLFVLYAHTFDPNLTYSIQRTRIAQQTNDHVNLVSIGVKEKQKRPRDNNILYLINKMVQVK